MKALLLALTFLWSVTAEAAIALKRGIALDIWVTWPAEADWSEPGFLDVFPEWRKTVGMDKIALIKAAGFDFVRLAIDPAPFLWKWDEKRTRHLIAETLETVELLKGQGLKVIIDMHTIPSGGYRKTGTEQIIETDLFAAHRRLVAEFAEALSTLDAGMVAFEVFNEPTNDCGEEPPRWPEMARSLHQAARTAAPDLTLVIQGGCWGGAEGLTALTPADFVDDNILWSFHTYNPFLVSHQGASWTGGTETYVSGLRYPPEAMNEDDRAALRKKSVARIKAAALGKAKTRELIEGLDDDLKNYFAPGWAAEVLEAPFKRVETWAKKNGVPPERIFLGEFGMIKSDLAAETRLEDRANLLKDIRAAAETRGYPWAVWSHGGSFAITGSDEGRVFEPALLKALGLP